MNVLVPPVANVSGAELVAPAAATVLADSGALPAGLYQVDVTWGSDDGALQNILQIARRNAANNADVAVRDQTHSSTVSATGGLFGGSGHVWFLVTLALNERVVVRNKGAGAAGKTWQAGITLSLVVS